MLKPRSWKGKRQFCLGFFAKSCQQNSTSQREVKFKGGRGEEDRRGSKSMQEKGFVTTYGVRKRLGTQRNGEA